MQSVKSLKDLFKIKSRYYYQLIVFFRQDWQEIVKLYEKNDVYLGEITEEFFYEDVKNG